MKKTRKPARKPENTAEKKLWAGRFTEPTARTVEEFTESVSFDRRLWKYDIEGSIAHARMLSRQGIIPKRDAALIIKGLREIAGDIEGGRFRFRRRLEDVHMNIEAALTERIGQAGERLHTGRSRNDQIALDLRLYLRAEIGEISSLLRAMQGVLLKQAERNAGIIMPGYTHMQRAQPVLLSHHLLAYVEMLRRDSSRLQDALARVNVLPLGAGALAGTSLPIDREFVARLLGFDKIAANSLDAVSDRDFIIEFLAAASILMVHLSRLCEEMVLWNTQEFSFISLPDAFATGSSLMPQKKNPDVFELGRAKAGRVFGALLGMLSLMKALPLAYNRDLQEDKPLLFDAVDTVKSVLSALSTVFKEVEFKGGEMALAAAGGYSTATELAEYLVKKGVPFRRAHEAAGRIVLTALKSGINELKDLGLEELRRVSPLFGPDALRLLSPAGSVSAKKSAGSTAPAEVKKQLEMHKRRLK